jgi:hypothetical protein
MTRRFLRVQPTWLLFSSIACLLLGMASVTRGAPIVIVVPNAYAEQEAPGMAGAPVNIRAMYIFAANQFAGLPPGGAYLASFRWRPDHGVLQPADFSVAQLTWRASVTNVPPDGMSLCFDQNVPDTRPLTVVLDAVNWKGHTDNLGPPEGPRVFDVEFVLDTPYHYDPDDAEEPNLLLDAKGYGLDWPVYLDRLRADEKSVAAVIVAADPLSDCGPAQWYVGSQVTELTFVHRLEGACCLPDGTCIEPFTSAACTDLGGTFRGMDTACGDGSICLGACCRGVNGCSETLINECSGDFIDYGSTCAQGCPCPDPFADVDVDGDVDQFDFAVLQSCLAGSDVTVSGLCRCFDRQPVPYPAAGYDGDVDKDDLDKFELCASGPGIPLDPDCDTW